MLELCVLFLVENVSPPILSESNRIVLSSLDPLTVVTPAMISAHDPDGSPEHVMFHIIATPSNGDIVKMLDGKEDVMSVRDSFSMQEVTDGRIMFRHRSEESGKENKIK